MTTQARFDAKWVERADGCWEWTGAISDNGYGKFRLNGATRLAHRVAYELFIRPIPAGLTLDHLCRNRACVNPTHLEAVTMRENVLRGPTLTAAYAARTHCKHGHEFTADNTTIRVHKGHPTRRCRTCQRERNARRRKETV